MGTSTVAVIGLGHMGGAFARRLLRAGHEVVVWNRTHAKVEQLVAEGAQGATSPADAAARAEAVITMVANPSALREVTESADGVAAGARTGTTVIEMSTVGPAAIARLASALPDGVDLLDAPVLGSTSEAEAGTLNVFVGGEPSIVERRRPLLSTFGTVVPVGPLGAGAAAKLVANSTLFGVLGVLGEALALADGLGLSRDAAFEVLAATPVAAQAQRRRAAVESGEYKLRFALRLARKDADLIAEAAAANGVDLRLALAARSWLGDAEHAGWGDRDYSAVLARIISGVAGGH
jgi:3-hydroxyisobutyrate dehydrogenase/2-hydroxy-3-oxopropionate reductase